MRNLKVYVSAPWQITTLEEEFDPIPAHPNEVVLQSLFTHISAGTELACIAGLESWFSIPNTPGYTSVATVLAVGANVSNLKMGDSVYTFGPHARYFRIDITDRWHGVCVKLPSGLDPDIAAFTHMGGIAITSLRASSIELGDVVGVSGLGTIGNLAAQFAQLQGALVIGTDINSARIEMARKSGILHCVNTKESSFLTSIQSLTGRDKVDVWIDASGQSAVIEQSMEYIRPGGEMVLLGSPRTEHHSNLTRFLQKIHLLDNVHVTGALEFLFPTHANDFNKHSIERNSAIIMDLMNAGKLHIRPFYTHRIKPEDASKAYMGLRDKPEEYVGIVIDWT